MTMHGPFLYRLTEDDMMDAGRAMTGRRLFRPPLRWMLLSIVGLSIVLLFVDLLDGMINLASLAVLIAAPMALFAVVRFVVPATMRRQFRQSAAMRDQHSIAFDETNLTFAGSRGSTNLPVAELFAFSETEKLILLHQTEGYFNAVPKAALGDFVPALTAVLVANGVKRF